MPTNLQPTARLFQRPVLLLLAALLGLGLLFGGCGQQKAQAPKEGWIYKDFP